jgi:Glycosyl hydrolase family 79, N-terminal domain
MLLKMICAASLLAGAALAQSPVTVVVNDQAPGIVVPDDFSGLSFEMQYVLPGADGKYLFSPKNHPLIAMFKTLGVKSLRVGGNTADRPGIAVPGPADADSLFAFAKAAGVKVIYTLRLRKGSLSNAVAIAKYIEQRYAPELACFAIGNEPDTFTHQYSVYRDEWKKYTTAITAVAPEAKFCGPCATPTRIAWSRQFADNFGKSGLLACLTQHDYPGGNGARATNFAVARDKMLSPAWLAHYEKVYREFGAPAKENRLPFRFDEANSFYNGGAKNVSDTFASALWALDFMHWWAAHGASGVNFHTGDKVAASDMNKPCRYAAFWTSSRGYNIHPLGYGIKAFALGGLGDALPLTVSNVDKINLTAYAVRRNGTLFVTLINKEHGPDGRAADVTIEANGIADSGQAIFLTAPGGNVAVKTGVTLGGALIHDDGSWDGKWSPIKSNEAGHCSLKLSTATAVILKIPIKETL